MKIYLYGAGKRGLEALKECRNCKEGNEITGFIDLKKMGEIKGINICSLADIIDLNALIVITPSNNKMIVEIYNDLKKRGFCNIYRFIPDWKKQNAINFIDKCCEYIGDWGDSVLCQVEMHIADGCNLNCRGCSHFSPIFNCSVFPDFESRMQDVKMLKKKFSHIKEFFILGGEPFLNPEINRYIHAIRKVLPKTDITIVTNGLLIPSLHSSIFKTIVDEKVKVSISEYEPTHVSIDRITKCLDEYGVVYKLRSLNTKQKFNKPISLSRNSVYEHLCISDGCVNIWNHKISRCPTLMYIDEFNKKFGTKLPTEGVFSLYTDLTGKDLLELLNSSVPLCAHCVKNEMFWSQCGRTVEMSDFATPN